MNTKLPKFSCGHTREDHFEEEVDTMLCVKLKAAYAMAENIKLRDALRSAPDDQVVQSGPTGIGVYIHWYRGKRAEALGEKATKPTSGDPKDEFRRPPGVGGITVTSES